MAALIDIPVAHYYNISESQSSAMLKLDACQGCEFYIDGRYFAQQAVNNPAPDSPLTTSEEFTASSMLSENEQIAAWEIEQRDLLLDEDYILLMDKIITYAANTPSLLTFADQVHWSLNTFGKILNNVIPSQIIVHDYNSLMLKLVEIAYSKRNLDQYGSKKKWVLSQFEIFAYILYKNATTTEEFQERAAIISDAGEIVDPLLGVDLIADLSDEEFDLVNSGDFHPLIRKIITHSTCKSTWDACVDQRNWSLLMFGEVLNRVTQKDQVKINDYPSLLIKLMEVAASNPYLIKGSSKKEWVLDQFEMILNTLYEGSSSADLALKQDYIDSAGCIIDAAKSLYNQNVILTAAGRRKGTAETVPVVLPVVYSNPQTNPTDFKQEVITQIAPDVLAQLTATSSNLTINLSGKNRLDNIAAIINDITFLIPSLINLDISALVAIEIGIVEGVLTIALPQIPGGAAYLPIAMPLVPFAVKAFNLAATELFNLGKVLFYGKEIHEIRVVFKGM